MFDNTDLATQFERVISRPLKAAPPMVVSSSVVVVIDALDECDDHDAVARHLSLIMKHVSCLLFIVTSRHLPGIAHELSKQSVFLEKRDLHSYSALHDIRALIMKELERDGQLWDIKEFLIGQVEVLVRASQGLFIWIKTIIKFIAENDDAKVDVLEKLLASSSHADAESALDELYRTVIEIASEKLNRRKTVKVILAIVLSSSRTSSLSPRALHAFLPPSISIPYRTFEYILNRLGAIFIISDDGVTVVHTSVLDFISNEMRIGEDFFMPLEKVERSMAAGCFEIMKNGTRNAKRQMQQSPSGLRFNICGLETSCSANGEVSGLDKRVAQHVSKELQYSCVHWFAHLGRARGGLSSPCGKDIATLLSAFLESTQSLFWLETLGLLGAFPVGREVLIGIQASTLPVSPLL